MTPSQHRRDFLKQSLLAGAGLILGIQSSSVAQPIRKLVAETLPVELNPYIILDAKGRITLVNSRIEMGQGAIQAISSMLAEDLDVRLDQIHVIPSDGTAKYGEQLTGGSGTVRQYWLPFRQAGAAAKEMLIQAAAQRWQVSPDQCSAKEGVVYLKGTDKQLTYGALAADAARLDVPENPKLKEPKDFKILGKVANRVDVPAKTNGTAEYAMDVVVPNLLYAVPIHSPAIHAKLIRFDATKALAVTGVRHVIKTERFLPVGQPGKTKKFTLWGGFGATDMVAVVADTYWAALKASRLVVIEWEDAALKATVNSATYTHDLQQAAKLPGVPAEEIGDFETLFTNAKTKLEAIYETPFLAHAAIEPVNATVHVKDDGTVDIWASVQGSDWALEQAAEYLNIEKSNVRVHAQLVGGSFGRKGIMDFLREALDISRQVKAPIKLIWPREEDMTQGPFRPAMMSKLRGGISSDKQLAGFSHQAIGESIEGQHWDGIKPDQPDSWITNELSQKNNNYAFPVYQLTYSRVKTPIPVSWWRSVYGSNFAWSQECFLDEMAHKAGIDPLTARKHLVKDAPRDRNVLEKLDELIKSYPPVARGHGRGIAMFRCYESMSAAMVEVAWVGKEIKVVQVTSVIDCGMCINPDNVKAQTEGNIVMGLTAAIKNGITFSDGKCDQTNFHQYQLLRLSEMPKINIHVMVNEEKPGGVGEPGMPPIAPALGNAIFALTGKRTRKLPIDLASFAVVKPTTPRRK